MPEPSLTSLSHGGGCGCKANPAVLRELLAAAKHDELPADERLLVGNATADDCAAWQLVDGNVIVASTDFFMPIVDIPHDFGRIAASNAISDIYAMGATPIFALALASMPLDVLSTATVGQILAGGKAACAAAGIQVAGGHTISATEPIYGLAVTGLCALGELARNDTARAGDRLILGKPLGIGILSAALRSGKLSSNGYNSLLATATQLNLAGPKLACAGLVQAMTDVTGFGLLGHALEMCRGANLRATLAFEQIPLLEEACTLARAGVVTGASARNWRAYGAQVECPNIQDWQRNLLTDPQTNGGLLIACAAADVPTIIATLQQHNCMSAHEIGGFNEGMGIHVRA